MMLVLNVCSITYIQPNILAVTPLTLGVTVEGELTYDFAYYSLEIPTAVSEMIVLVYNINY